MSDICENPFNGEFKPEIGEFTCKTEEELTNGKGDDENEQQ